MLEDLIFLLALFCISCLLSAMRIDVKVTIHSNNGMNTILILFSFLLTLVSICGNFLEHSESSIYFPKIPLGSFSFLPNSSRNHLNSNIILQYCFGSWRSLWEISLVSLKFSIVHLEFSANLP